MPPPTPTTMPPPRDPGSPPVHVVIPSDPAEARRVRDQVEQCLAAASCHDHDRFSIKLALEEALLNAIRHGNQYDPARTVQIAYRLLPDRFEVHITDEGAGFDPDDVPDPTAPENLECPGGRGLFLMRHYMTEISFNQRGNAVTMCKVLHNGKQ
jgi:serine/threonine-protein kinase RsbW